MPQRSPPVGKTLQGTLSIYGGVRGGICCHSTILAQNPEAWERFEDASKYVALDAFVLGSKSSSGFGGDK